MGRSDSSPCQDYAAWNGYAVRELTDGSIAATNSAICCGCIFAFAYWLFHMRSQPCSASCSGTGGRGGGLVTGRCENTHVCIQTLAAANLAVAFFISAVSTCEIGVSLVPCVPPSRTDKSEGAPGPLGNSSKSSGNQIQLAEAPGIAINRSYKYSKVGLTWTGGPKQIFDASVLCSCTPGNACCVV